MKKVAHTFPLFDTFRQVLEKASNIADTASDKEQISHEEVFAKIEAALHAEQPDEIADWATLTDDVPSVLGQLAEQITYAHLLKRIPLQPYWGAAHMLRDALYRAKEIPVLNADDERWTNAVAIALTHLPRWTVDFGERRLEPRNVTLAQAVHFFNGRGIAVNMRGNEAETPTPAISLAMSASLFQPLIALGDERAFQMVNGILALMYEQSIARLRLHPTPDLMGAKMDRAIPYGLLFRYALKTLGRDRVNARFRSSPQDILQTAIHFGALFDVEPFSTYETMFPPKPGYILELLRRIVTYDELFTIPQCTPSVARRLIEEIFDQVRTAEADAALGWDVDDAKKLWALLQSASVHDVASTFVARSTFAKTLESLVGSSRSKALLGSFSLERANHGYAFPSDAARAQTRHSVIVAASKKRFWIPGRILLGPPFFERLISCRLTHANRNASSLIGVAFETRLVTRMRELGIRCRSGIIKGPGRQRAGDADLIIETDDVLALFELKKKAPTGKTIGGNDLYLAIDLARGLGRAIGQLGKHELTLMRTGRLEFEDGTSLVLNGRRIMKGVISLGDYGGLHDAAIVRHTLRGFAGAILEPTNVLSGIELEALEEANEILQTLRTLATDFGKAKSKDDDRDFFDNVVFHNVFFIEHMVERNRSAASFIGAILRGSRITNGSRDPFFENAQFESRDDGVSGQ
ncbi:hypothetical protein [Caballeronia sp. DA-9]|uniref:hypothetical protein n=1 Tax=Caballeronia sp. DA-9 TaxID=3436237 RepID=UPI003F67905E